MSDKPAVLFSAGTIEERIHALGREIAGAYDGQALCVVGLMKGCLVFMADLIRSLPLELTCYFLQSASLREADADMTDLIYSADVPYAGRHVLLLDDLIDTGITQSFLSDHIREHRPRSLKLCVLIDKLSERKVNVQPDWAAFTLKEPLDGFIVGYGLDFAERYRELPYLGTIPRPASQGGPPNS